jgi:uncharacterized RDD family membrane protein YckC
MANDGDSDYTKYTSAELREALTRIDRNRYPINLAALNREIAAREQQNAGENIAPPSADIMLRKYSTFWPRFWAGILDGLVQRPIDWIETFIFAYTTSISLRVLAVVFCSVAFLVYSIWMHARFGQTLGKMICKVVVLDVSEGPLTLKQAALRDIFGLITVPILLAVEIPQTIHGIDVSTQPELSPLMWVILSSSLVWFLIEIFTMLTNTKRRALHDYIAGTVVIRKASMSSPLSERVCV